MHQEVTKDRIIPFQRNDKLRELVLSQPQLLPVLSRFNIALGFGESTVEEVCRRNDVNVETFLTVCNFFSSRDFALEHVNIESLVGYLKSAHRYFLEYVLPDIRTRLIAAISTGTKSDTAWMMIKFYDSYVVEVQSHMKYEDDVVFEYVLNLIKGLCQSGFTIEDFVENHLPIADKLREIKELFIGHYSADLGRVDMLNSVLFDIMHCERDLLKHCALEDRIFVPAVRRMEQKVDRSSTIFDTITPKIERNEKELDEHGDVVLTAREKDIVKAVARGLSNKEIADKLFLSVHTVTTHRRNISNKLNIHSSAGLAVYAIMHGIMTLEEGAVTLQ